jgi:hypothetical protein
MGNFHDIVVFIVAYTKLKSRFNFYPTPLPMGKPGVKRYFFIQP